MRECEPPWEPRARPRVSPERLKAAELLAKLMGWFAPTHHVTKRLPPQEGPASYAALVETIRSFGEEFTPQELEAMRKELLQVIAEATKAVELLAGPGSS